MAQTVNYTAPADRIWTRTYVTLCIAAFLPYVHQSLLTPILPLYLEGLGASAFMIGVVLASFSVFSVLLRPSIAVLSDRWSKPGVLGGGALLLSLCSFVFLIPSIPISIVANTIRGVGWGALNLGGYSLLAQVAPTTRRGEASGYYSSVVVSAGVIFPAIALALVAAPWAGFPLVLIMAGVFAFLGTVMSIAIPRGLQETPKQSTDNATKAAGVGFLDRRVVFASSLLLLTVLPQSAMQSFITLYARDLGVEQLGLYFLISGAAGLLSRPPLGRLADRFGHAPSLLAGFFLTATGAGLVATAQGLPLLLSGGILFSVGVAMTMSSSTALAIERAGVLNPDKAMATFSASGQIGNGIGSILTGTLVHAAGYRGMYGAMAAILAFGLLLVAANVQSLRRSAAGGS